MHRVMLVIIKMCLNRRCRCECCHRRSKCFSGLSDVSFHEVGMPFFDSFTPCEWEVEYVHRIPACRMRWLKGCPDGSAYISVGLRRHPMYPLSGCRPKMMQTFSNLSCQIPTQPLLQMVQHVADWVAPFPRSQHSPPLLLKLLHIPPSPPSSSSFPYVHET